MKLPEFVFIQSKEIQPRSGDLVLHTVPLNNEYLIFGTVRFEDGRGYDHFLDKWQLHNSCVQIEGYWIILIYEGTLEDLPEGIVPGHKVPTSAASIFESLSKFYKQERIDGNETRLKKYLR